MADSIITKQELIDAQKDAQTLEEVISGEPGKLVETRLGRKVYTLASVPQINTMTREEVNAAVALKANQADVDASITAIAGGHKAYQTLAAAQAAQSSLPANTAIEVTNDGANNGTYQWNGTSLTKSNYDPLTQAAIYTDSKITNTNKKLTPEIDISGYAAVRYFPSSTQNKWINVSGYTGIVVPVKEDVTYKFEIGNTLSPCILYPLKTAIPQTELGFSVAKITELPTNTVTQYTMPADHNYLWIAHTNANRLVLPKSFTEVDFKPVLRSDIAINAYERSDIKVPNINTVGLIRREVDRNNQLLSTIPSSDAFEKINIEPYASFADGMVDHSGVPTFSPNIYAIAISLNAGDVLSFEYYPFLGTVLWQGTSQVRGYAILTELESSNTPKSYTFTAYKNMTVYLANHKGDSVFKNGVKINTYTYAYLSNYARVTLHPIRSYNPNANYSDYKSLPEIAVKKGDVIKITDVGSADIIAIKVLSPATGDIYLGVAAVAPDNPNKELVWTAPSDCRIVLTAKNTGSFYIKRAASVSYALNNFSGAKEIVEISEIHMPEMERVFATHQNYILKMVTIDEIEKIAFSDNLGKTWSYTDNTLGEITTYHFFTDGTIMLCTKTKVFWTTDGINYTESVIYDYDGSIYTAPEDEWRFFNQQNGDRPMSVDGVEMYVWGEYVRSGNIYPAIFYTTDFGRTIKCATRFGKSVMAGQVRPSRHVHRIYFDDKNEKFFVATGDAGNECMLIDAKYTPSTDTWTWDVLGAGDEWKFGTMWVDKFYLYIITDYTTAALKPVSGIYRVSLNHLRDITKYKMIYHAAPEEWGSVAPFRLIVDRMGNKVQLPDVAGRGVIWVATEGFNFKKVIVRPNLLLSYIIGPNYNGDIYCSGNLVQDETQILSGTNFNLTTALRNAGITNFMRGEIMFDDLISFTE